MSARDRLGHDDLVHQCLAHLQALPFVRRAKITTTEVTLADNRYDALLSIKTPTDEHELPCEVKRAHLRKEIAAVLVQMAKRQPGLVLFAPAIGRELGETLEQAGVNFVDAAGNCYLRLGNQYIARIQGRSPPERARMGRGLRAPAYRVLLALLIKPELIDAPSRAIASEADVSPQTANELRRRLIDQHIVVQTGGSHRWLPGRRKDALTLWLAGFTTTLVPSLLIGRFRAQERDPAQLQRRIEPLLDAACEWRYGGGAAAQLFTEYFRGDRTVLYVLNAPADLSERLRFVRDAHGPIVLSRTPGRLAFESPDRRCVHPLLAYADLLAEGEPRAHEAADELRERFLSDLELPS